MGKEGILKCEVWAVTSSPQAGPLCDAPGATWAEVLGEASPVGLVGLTNKWTPIHAMVLKHKALV